MKRVIYDNERVLAINENDTSHTYTPHMVKVAELDTIKAELQALNIDVSLIDKYAGQPIADYAEPTTPLINYDVVNAYPEDPTISTKAFWIGEKHEVQKVFRIDLLVLHYRGGHRVKNLDKTIFIEAVKGRIIQNPNTPGQMVDEYDFFMGLVYSGMRFPDVIQIGIQTADQDGSIDKKLKDKKK